MLTLNSSFALNIGDVWVLACAIFFAWYIILVGKYTKIFESIKFTLIQLVIVALITGLTSVIKGKMEVPQGYIVWQAILFCSILATSFMYVVQNHFQKYNLVPLNNNIHQF